MKDPKNELQQTYAKFIEAIEAIPEDNINNIPFEDSWTAAQVVEHVWKSLGVDVLYGKTQLTERDPGEQIKPIADLFLNMDIKMQSPDFIYPSDKQYEKQELLDMINDKFTKIIDTAATLDLSLTCLDFSLPGSGLLTRLEFIWFYIVHTQRHTFQLQKISRALAG